MSDRCNSLLVFAPNAPVIDSWKAQLAAELRTRREALGLSLDKLAEAAGVGKATVADLESQRGGDQGPGVFTLRKIAEALQTTVGALCGDPVTIAGKALIDQGTVDAIEAAKSVGDVKALEERGWRYGLILSDRFKWASPEELAEVEQRCNARIADLVWKRRGKRS